LGKTRTFATPFGTLKKEKKGFIFLKHRRFRGILRLKPPGKSTTPPLPKGFRGAIIYVRVACLSKLAPALFLARKASQVTWRVKSGV
jgi:hypothetical protein